MSEPRSFALEPRSVGEFLRIDPKGKTDRQLLVAALQQAEATHGCLEKHIAVSELAMLAATEAREDLAKKVDGVATAVGGLETRTDILEGGVTALAKAFGGTVHGEARKVKVEAPMSIKDHLKIGGTILGSLAGAVLLYQILWPAILALHNAIMAATP